jgi:hypothetical protein
VQIQVCLRSWWLTHPFRQWSYYHHVQSAYDLVLAPDCSGSQGAVSMDPEVYSSGDLKESIWLWNSHSKIQVWSILCTP